MNKSTVETAFRRLFPGTALSYDFRIKFSGKFSPYNANVRQRGNLLVFNFSREWKSVSEEISIGLVQELLLKTLNKKASTTNIDLYNGFVKKLYLSADTPQTDPRLQEIFEKVNAEYFHGSMDVPNLKWGLNSRVKLATYDYHTDTINVSKIFRNADEKLLGYLLYHEMLHKKLKFSSRNVHHSREFRIMEKAYGDRDEMEKRLNSFVRKRKFMRWLPF